MKIAVIDSGISAVHPHVRAISGGIGVTGAEGWMEDTSDRLGHGTTVAAVIREKVPDADLFAVKVFDRNLSVRAEVIGRALNWCRYHGMDLVNLSIGVDDASQRAALESAVAGLLVVSVASQLPGCLPGVIAVAATEACPRDEFRYHEGVFYASPYPRPATRSAFKGVDFAVANMTGIVARVLPSIMRRGEPVSTLRTRLIWELTACEETQKSLPSTLSPRLGPA